LLFDASLLNELSTAGQTRLVGKNCFILAPFWRWSANAYRALYVSMV